MWRLGSLSLCLASIILSCTHPKSDDSGKIASASELGVVDPDPSRYSGPEFCNPTGRQGNDLKRCLDQNEGLYKEFAEEAKRREPWFNFAGEGWVESQELDDKYVIAVQDPAVAVKKLEQSSVVELTVPEVNQITGRSTDFAGRKPYLVRALMYHKDSGRFAVFEKGQDIFVRHDSTGPASQKEHRTAVVLFLPFKPVNIFIDCQVL
ncbi:MAG: hypothetical protein FJ146_03980 [Deltaproteobacteria bacterium]|nr:hypothetical protein [Deltaproteobacteria bacterium]